MATMLSSDKNIETLTQLIEMLKHNIELRTEFAKLDVTARTVRLLTAGTLALLLLLIIFAAMLFASAAAAVSLAQSVGLSAALLIVAACYVLLFIIIWLVRRPLIERPLVRFLSNVLLS